MFKYEDILKFVIGNYEYCTNICFFLSGFDYINITRETESILVLLNT